MTTPTVSDPTDFLPPLSHVDASLRCLVCKDFYTTPMLTTCSHTFCSLCIRRCLATDGKCPACRQGEQEVRLRRNVAVEDVVDAWVRQGGRERVLGLGRDVEGLKAGEGERGVKRKVGAVEEGEGERMTRRRTRREVAAVTPGLETEAEVEREVITIDDGEDGADADYLPDDGLVPCPMCGRRMKEDKVYLHLDRCEMEQRNGVVAIAPLVTAKSQPPPRMPASPRQATQAPPTPLPKLNYSLYKETALRKKLTELGIRATGPKPLLERRHSEWVNIWNANCDSTRPRPRRELLLDLDTWERTQGGLAPGLTAASGGGVMRKDFDGRAWASGHKDDFKDLIAKARMRRKVDEREDVAREDDGKVEGQREVTKEVVTKEEAMKEDDGKTEGQEGETVAETLRTEDAGETNAESGGLEMEVVSTTELVVQEETRVESDPIVDVDVAVDEALSSRQTPPASLPNGDSNHSNHSIPSTHSTPSKFKSSPAKPRMFVEAEDPIVEAEPSSLPVR